MQKFIVAIAGPRAAGKTTAASHISNNLNGIRRSLTELRAGYEKRYQLSHEPWLSEYAPCPADVEAAIWKELSEILLQGNATAIIIEDILYQTELEQLQRLAQRHERQLICLYLFAELNVRFTRHNQSQQGSIERSSFDQTLDGDNMEYTLATIATLCANHDGATIDTTRMTVEQLRDAALAIVYAQIEPDETLAR